MRLRSTQHGSSFTSVSSGSRQQLLLLRAAFPAGRRLHRLTERLCETTDGDIAFNVLYWQHMIRIYRTEFWPDETGFRKGKAWRFVTCFLYFLAYLVYAGELSTFIFAHDGVDRFSARDSPITAIQTVVSGANNALNPSKW